MLARVVLRGHGRAGNSRCVLNGSMSESGFEPVRVGHWRVPFLRHTTRLVYVHAFSYVTDTVPYYY